MIGCFFSTDSCPRRVPADGEAAGVPRRAEPGSGRFRPTGRGAMPGLSRAETHEGDGGVRPRIPLPLPGALS